MDSEQDLTLIDAYLNGTLSAEEQAAVDRRLANDNAFQELYKFTQSVQRVARQQERQRIKAMLQALESDSDAWESVEEPGAKVIPISSYPRTKDQQTTRQPKIIRWPLTTVGIAAAVIATLLVWQPTRSSNEEVFVAYAETTTSTATLAGLTETGGITGTRGEERTLDGFTAAETDELAQAVEALRTKDYENTKTLLKPLLRAKGEQPVLLQNLAVAQLNSNQVDEAVRNLESLIRRPDLAFRDEVSYDLALGYIKQNNLSKARSLLQAIANSDSKRAASASAILHKLRWWF